MYGVCGIVVIEIIWGVILSIDIHKNMLYKIAHFLRDQMPWLWNLVDVMNSMLFRMRYGKELDHIEIEICNKCDLTNLRYGNYYVVPIREVATEELVEFFAAQPVEAYVFFRPHGFDAQSIMKLQRNRAFLAYVLRDVENGKIAGYCFNRSFFNGKGFRGRMVDIEYRGNGLGTMMNRLLNKVGFGIGLRLFETVSKDNVASYRSAISASSFRIIEELPHNELYLEIINDMKHNNINTNLIGGGKSHVVILQPLFVANNTQERRAA